MGRPKNKEAVWCIECGKEFMTHPSSIKRDQGICQYCGLTEKQSLKKYNAKCSVHHIEKRRAFRERGEPIENSSKLTNLITLCASCHHRAEAGKIILQPKLL